MDQSKALIIAREFASLVLKEFSPQEILLYGSYAKGTAREESDIDIAVVFDELESDWLESASRLSGIAWSVSDFIEPHILENKHDHSGFLASIREHAMFIA